MPRRAHKPREYRFEIDAFTPDTIPLARLSQYLGDLARMMGQESSVHFVKVESGSTVPVIRVDWEADPKVQERLRAVKFNDGPAEARRAYRELNKRLVEDNANGVLVDSNKKKVIKFPGRDGANQPEFGPISQPGVFVGTPIRIGGENDPVPVHLDDGVEKHIAYAPRRLAKQIAPYLFSSVVRIEGNGRWQRNKMGEWELLSFYATSFQALPTSDLRGGVEALRAIPAAWKKSDDPIADLLTVRTGERPH